MAFKKFTNKFKSQISQGLITALGFVLALQYREYLNKLIDLFFLKFLPFKEASIKSDTAAVIILTVLVVFGTMYVQKYFKK